MMKSLNVRNLMLAGLVWGLASSAAIAQLGGNRIEYPLGGPTVSPYLNLLGSSYGAGINYYGLVRPQQQFYQQSQDLRQGVYNRSQQNGQRMQPNQNLNGSMRSAYRLGTTGHATSFRVIGNVQQQQQSGGLSSPLSSSLNSGNRFGSGGDNGMQSGRQTGFSGHSAGFGGYGATYGGQQNGF